MPKSLSSISLDSPTSPVSGVNSFTFSGTPTFTGKGGIDPYDFRWEVDNGAGYVPIGAATGLTTADVNPLVATTSPNTNSITVNCTDPGEYTIRMAGAPTTGGSYTVFSPTQTVSVAAGVTGTMAVTESGSDTFTATGTVTDPAVTGTMAVTESGQDSFTASGTVAVTGTLSVTESGQDTFTASGTVEASAPSGISGSLAVTETGTDTFTASGTVTNLEPIGDLVLIEEGLDIFEGKGIAAPFTVLPPRLKRFAKGLP